MKFVAKNETHIIISSSFFLSVSATQEKILLWDISEIGREVLLWGQETSDHKKDFVICIFLIFVILSNF